LPEHYGSWQTTDRRFYRWQKQGIWQLVLKELQKEKDNSGEVEWEIHFVDSTIIRAHQHAAGAKGGTRGKP
jgi:transposase